MGLPLVADHLMPSLDSRHNGLLITLDARRRLDELDFLSAQDGRAA